MSSAAGPALEALAERACSRGRIGFDTEFVSEGRYRALLCLVQLVVEGDEGPEIVVIDALDGEARPGPVGEVLADPAIEVVVHAGRQDIPLVKRMWGGALNLFDTQIAAACGASVQPSYEALLGQFLRTRVEVGHVHALGPAAADRRAALLRTPTGAPAAAGGFRCERLEQRGRLEWAREESRPLEDASDERDPEEIFRRLPRVADLKAQAAAVASS